ncbi:histidine kinase dimerization/phospho-acceptor domain-containing protein [Sporosarcina sp. NPDC096371]|uniref:HAMP domain-containing sensor histidine kinase n=1 Tax=Sporosarcina sp. NPDC096371 TaxID=3364530 RepID=UPI0038194E8D
MKKLKNSLLLQYLLIILLATTIIPITIPVLSIIFYNGISQEESPDRYYNGTDLENMWHQTAKGLAGASEEQIHSKLKELKSIYQESSIYWVDGTGQTRDKFPESLSIPNQWSASFAIDFIKKNRGNTIDPFTVVAFIGNNPDDGFMVLQLPRADMVSPNDLVVKSYNYILPIALLLIFMLFILISMLFFYRIRKRLLHLQEAMVVPEANGIPSTVEVTKEDEIGRLGQSFNRMIHELETSREREQEEETLRKELIANLSHDLRTPLTTIRGHAYRLKKESLSPTGQESLDFIDEKVSYMGELIENLLSYTLLASGKYPFHPETIDINRLIRTSFAAWYPVFENLHFDIQLNIPEKKLLWEVDPQMFHRVLDNLFQNIYRHARSGQFVAVRIEHETLIIEDYGPGMKVKSNQQGVGVGLSVVSLMLKEMQLDWTIETDERGTRMMIKKY